MKNLVNEKPILALETSGRLCSAAVYFNETEFYTFTSSKKHSHSEKIFELTEKVLEISSVKLSEIRCIAVSSGPGSFTGLRIGLSAAKGMAYGASVPICPVPTFEAMALEITEFVKDEDQFVIANRINMDELYFSRFFIKSNNYIFVDNLKVISNNQLPQLSEGCKIFGDNKLSVSGISSPDAVSVAKWCDRYGSELITENYDYLEPNYLKEFIVKERM